MGGRLQLAAAAALALRGRGQPAAGDPDEEAGLFDCGLGAERFRAVRGARSGEAGVEAGGCQWVRVVGASFLPGHAGGVASASRSFSEAKAACEEMGEGCAGVTLQPCATEDDLVYSLRASRDWHASPYGETSWLKECGASEEAPEAEAAPASAERCGEDRFVRLREAASDFYADGVRMGIGPPAPVLR
ncbi:unnamed protein product [Prorocentrum cordatum]|uniref:C-type lectin domain-containing protein n=1 Tax=Prorocentrum cordatum TaxID=2364126 RepID=A0ABN9W8E6_9DINO|nr:unnamed protein product [Polarella glacialis]